MGRGIPRMGKKARENRALLKVTRPSWSLEHKCLLPLQFLRNSLKKMRGSNWSLRLSKELNNQIESFDSPSLEKVGPHGGREGDKRGVGVHRVTLCAGWSKCTREERGVVWTSEFCFSLRSCFVEAGALFSSHQLAHPSHFTLHQRLSCSRVQQASAEMSEQVFGK